MPSDAQQFLNDLDKTLWNATDRLRAALDAAVYKHAVLGLIFLKYVSDSFRMRQDEVTALLQDPEMYNARLEARAQQKRGSNGH